MGEDVAGRGRQFLDAGTAVVVSRGDGTIPVPISVPISVSGPIAISMAPPTALAVVIALLISVDVVGVVQVERRGVGVVQTARAGLGVGFAGVDDGAGRQQVALLRRGPVTALAIVIAVGRMQVLVAARIADRIGSAGARVGFVQAFACNTNKNRSP